MEAEVENGKISKQILEALLTIQVSMLWSGLPQDLLEPAILRLLFFIESQGRAILS
jgi:hypothetical protein